MSRLFGKKDAKGRLKKEQRELRKELLPSEESMLASLRQAHNISGEREAKFRRMFRYLVARKLYPRYSDGKGGVIDLREKLKSKIVHEREKQRLYDGEIRMLVEDITAGKEEMKRERREKIKDMLRDLNLLPEKKKEKSLLEEAIEGE